MKDDNPKWWYIIEPNARMAETCTARLPEEDLHYGLKVNVGNGKMQHKTGWQTSLETVRQILQFGIDERLGFECRVARTSADGTIRYARRTEYLTPEQRRHNEDRQLGRELLRHRLEDANRLVSRKKFGTVPKTARTKPA